MAMTITADMVLKLTVEYDDDDNCRHDLNTYRRVWDDNCRHDLKLTVEYGDDDNSRHGFKTYRRVWR